MLSNTIGQHLSMMKAAPVSCMLLLSLVSAAALATAAEPEGGVPASISSTVVVNLQLRGIGELRFGERLEWRLVSERPVELRAGEGIRVGPVSIRSATGNVRHSLPEVASFSRAEVGNGCSVSRVEIYAVIRCNRDYVFNTRTGAAPIVITPQFNDRSEAAPAWLRELPLPWWQLSGGAIADTPLVFLGYGYVNYGQAIESTTIYRGPALLDLQSGRIAIARTGVFADSPAYDASLAGDSEPIALFPERLVADEMRDGRRTITVSTAFDRCVAARCRGDSNIAFRRVLPLTYIFE
jgi:hypothetical protein